MHGKIIVINTMHGIIKNLGFNRVFVIIESMDSEDSIEVRRIQALAGERSFTLVFPKQFATELGVGRGDFVKCRIHSGRLVVEKMNP
jgi:hypothetical protein